MAPPSSQFKTYTEGDLFRVSVPANWRELPGSSAVTPLAGNLIARGYSRSEEYAADRHGVTLLNRAGYSKDVLINALTWVSRSSAGSGGGFLSTHPATDDRIEELRRLA